MATNQKWVVRFPLEPVRILTMVSAVLWVLLLLWLRRWSSQVSAESNRARQSRH